MYDRPIPWARRLPLIPLIPLSAGLQWIASGNPAFADGWAGTVSPVVARGLGLLTGWLPFSVAELLIVLLVLWLLLALRRAVRRVRLGARRAANVLAHSGVNGLALIGVVYALFVVWGLNYHRTPLAERAGYDTSPPSATELRALCIELIDETNAARRAVREDDDGVMRLEETPRRMLGRAWRGFHRAEQIYDPLLRGYAGKPKGLTLLSTPMSYMGLDGVYLMFTGEPSVNMKLPDPSLPSVACHETAHQVGWAREEEASYAGYLACTLHPDADFRYSARFDALRRAMTALRRADPEEYRRLEQRCSPEVMRDWQALREFRARHTSWATGLTSRLNDAYLRSQGQEAGIASYGLMVDLLIAERRQGRPADR